MNYAETGDVITHHISLQIAKHLIESCMQLLGRFESRHLAEALQAHTMILLKTSHYCPPV